MTLLIAGPRVLRNRGSREPVYSSEQYVPNTSKARRRIAVAAMSPDDVAQQVIAQEIRADLLNEEQAISRPSGSRWSLSRYVAPSAQLKTRVWRSIRRVGSIRTRCPSTPRRAVAPCCGHRRLLRRRVAPCCEPRQGRRKGALASGAQRTA